ncbi:TetR/AcrR family transcriptional regulator [Streptococcus pluranimalium]|uniref:TetR/AcrR family transcriptional regulator n=1 Tax=Streptococcus hyovaginalis TaxID=149015 RepID=UPI0014782EC5|nr:TetR family transcriptional regulator [Streptococcus hyovaginalis]
MNQDLRYIKTEHNLRSAMLQLLKEKEFQKIAVTDICKLANCSRNAFYQHYEGKENLYQAIVTDIVIAIEESCRPVVESLSELNFEAEKLYLSNILTAVEDNRSVLTQLLMLPQEDFSKQVKAMIITALTQNVGGWEKQVSLDYIHYFAGGITSFTSYWLTQTSYDLDQAVEALVAVTLGHWKAAETSSH